MSDYQNCSSSVPSQTDYQQLLNLMHRENYTQFRPAELKQTLLSYFFFLERAITGKEATAYVGANFSISELEAIVAELESALIQTNAQKQRAVDLLSKLTKIETPSGYEASKVTAIVGDITRQHDCDAIVNAANTQLRKGGGVCGAIHLAAGPELEKSTSKFGIIKVGEAVISPGFNLPNAWVIHVAGPRYAFDENPAALLAKSMRNVLSLAETNKLTSVAVPAISTGVYGYPVHLAAPILVGVAKDMSFSFEYLRLIRFVLYSESVREKFLV